MLMRLLKKLEEPHIYSEIIESLDYDIPLPCFKMEEEDKKS